MHLLYKSLRRCVKWPVALKKVFAIAALGAMDAEAELKLPCLASFSYGSKLDFIVWAPVILVFTVGPATMLWMYVDVHVFGHFDKLRKSDAAAQMRRPGKTARLQG